MATNSFVKKIKKIPLISNIFGYYHFHTQLKNALDGCETVLDLGCGADSPFAAISKDFKSVGVDAFEPSIKKAKELGIHNEYCLMDVMDIDKKFAENSFDCVLLTDLIEHLEKQDGMELLKKMEKIAKKKIVIFTPNGFLPQSEYDKNPFQVHKSGWTASEMKSYGYKVIGFGGLKGLRGELAQIKYKPYILWKIITEVSEIFVRDFPSIAFSILCVKNKQK